MRSIGKSYTFNTPPKGAKPNTDFLLKILKEKNEDFISKNFWEHREKVGEWIYPRYNDTARFGKETRWDLITRVDESGMVLDIKTFFNYSTVRAIETMQELYDLSLKPQKEVEE